MYACRVGSTRLCMLGARHATENVAFSLSCSGMADARFAAIVRESRVAFVHFLLLCAVSQAGALVSLVNGTRQRRTALVGWTNNKPYSTAQCRLGHAGRVLCFCASSFQAPSQHLARGTARRVCWMSRHRSDMYPLLTSSERLQLFLSPCVRVRVAPSGWRRHCPRCSKQ